MVSGPSGPWTVYFWYFVSLSPMSSLCTCINFIFHGVVYQIGHNPLNCTKQQILIHSKVFLFWLKRYHSIFLPKECLILLFFNQQTTCRYIVFGSMVSLYCCSFQVRNDEESDQLATYFRCEMVPKVLITSSDRSKLVS